MKLADQFNIVITEEDMLQIIDNALVSNWSVIADHRACGIDMKDGAFTVQFVPVPKEEV